MNINFYEKFLQLKSEHKFKIYKSLMLQYYNYKSLMLHILSNLKMDYFMCSSLGENI